MTNPKPKQRDNYKAPFMDKYGRARAGAHFEANKRMPTGTNRLIKLVIKRAKEKTGWTWPQLAFYLRMGKSPNTINFYYPGVLKNADMTRIRYDKYIELCKLAGIPRGVAAVIYAQSYIPDGFPKDRDAIGLAYRALQPGHFIGDTKEDKQAAFDLVKDDVKASARSIPDASRAKGMNQIYSGMPLPRQTRDL